MKKILKTPILYLIAISALLIAFNIVNVSKAFNKPTANPYSGTGAVGVASGAPTNWVRLTSAGRVGVGTTTPSYVLSISSSTDDLFNLTRVSASYPTIFKVGTDNTFVVNSGNSDILTFQSGNIGIGTTTLASKLSIVNGGITIDGVSQRGFWNSNVPINNATTSIDIPGHYSSIAIGIDGLPVISYFYADTSDLKVVKCGNMACSSNNTLSTVDSTLVTGLYTSIAIGTDGLPIIAYHQGSNFDLKIAKCGNAACSSGNTITTVDSTGSVGFYPSIGISTDGLPVVSYYGGLALKVLKCGNAACSSGNTVTIVDSSAADVGAFTSIAIEGDGLPVISYFDNTNDDLKVVKCGNSTCSSGNSISVVDASMGSINTNVYNTSITISYDGFPIVAYQDNANNDLKILKCGNVSCSSGNTIATVDSENATGYHPSIAISNDGLPIISYLSLTSADLKVVKCGNSSCSSGNTITTIDSSGSVGYYTSVAIGSDGLPVISYLDLSYGLRVAKCANPWCAPYFTRR